MHTRSTAGIDLRNIFSRFKFHCLPYLDKIVIFIFPFPSLERSLSWLLPKRAKAAAMQSAGCRRLLVIPTAATVLALGFFSSVDMEAVFFRPSLGYRRREGYLGGYYVQHGFVSCLHVGFCLIGHGQVDKLVAGRVCTIVDSGDFYPVSIQQGFRFVSSCHRYQVKQHYPIFLNFNSRKIYTSSIKPQRVISVIGSCAAAPVILCFLFVVSLCCWVALLGVQQQLAGAQGAQTHSRGWGSTQAVTR